MAIFLVRVEFCNSESADYVELHKKMSEKNFYKFFTFSGNKANFPHPGTEYKYYGLKTTKTIEFVSHLAKAIAEKIRPNPKILVTDVRDFSLPELDKF